MSIKKLIPLFALTVIGSFFLTLYLTQQYPGLGGRGANTLATLLTAPKNYKFKTRQIDTVISKNGDWLSVSDRSEKKASRLQWVSRSFGDAREHVFDLVVRKEKGRALWSQLMIYYQAGKVREQNIYRFRPDTGVIKVMGIARPDMLRILDEGDSWRLIGRAYVPDGASVMGILLYPAPGKNRSGTLNIKEFRLSETS